MIRQSCGISYLLSILRKRWQQSLFRRECRPNIQTPWYRSPQERQRNLPSFWSIDVRNWLHKGPRKLSLWRDFNCRFCRGSSQWYALFKDVFMVPLWRCTFPNCSNGRFSKAWWPKKTKLTSARWILQIYILWRSPSERWRADRRRLER